MNKKILIFGLLMFVAGTLSVYAAQLGGSGRLTPDRFTGSIEVWGTAQLRGVSTEVGLYVNSSGNVGIGTMTSEVTLGVAQNGALKVGNAYLSSGGDYTNLSNNGWFNGSSWITPASGAFYRQSGQTHYWGTHDASGNTTGTMTLDASGNLSVQGAANFSSIVGQTSAGQKTLTASLPTGTMTTIRTVVITKEAADSSLIVMAHFGGIPGTAAVRGVCAVYRGGTTLVAWNQGGAFDHGYRCGTGIDIIETGLATGTYTYTLAYNSSLSSHTSSSLIVFELKN